MLILVMSALTARTSSSSGTPEEPCKNQGHRYRSPERAHHLEIQCSVAVGHSMR